MEWMPIETAPKDGSYFLAYESGCFYKCAVFDLCDDRPVYSVWCGQPVVMQPEPTHWMPLPAPPERP